MEDRDFCSYATLFKNLYTKSLQKVENKNLDHNQFSYIKTKLESLKFYCNTNESLSKEQEEVFIETIAEISALSCKDYEFMQFFIDNPEIIEYINSISTNKHVRSLAFLVLQGLSKSFVLAPYMKNLFFEEMKFNLKVINSPLFSQCSLLYLDKLSRFGLIQTTEEKMEILEILSDFDFKRLLKRRLAQTKMLDESVRRVLLRCEVLTNVAKNLKNMFMALTYGLTINHLKSNPLLLLKLSLNTDFAEYSPDVYKTWIEAAKSDPKQELKNFLIKVAENDEKLKEYLKNYESCLSGALLMLNLSEELDHALKIKLFNSNLTKITYQNIIEKLDSLEVYWQSEGLLTPITAFLAANQDFYIKTLYEFLTIEQEYSEELGHLEFLRKILFRWTTVVYGPNFITFGTQFCQFLGSFSLLWLIYKQYSVIKKSLRNFRLIFRNISSNVLSSQKFKTQQVEFLQVDDPIFPENFDSRNILEDQNRIYHFNPGTQKLIIYQRKIFTKLDFITCNKIFFLGYYRDDEFLEESEKKNFEKFKIDPYRKIIKRSFLIKFDKKTEKILNDNLHRKIYDFKIWKNSLQFLKNHNTFLNQGLDEWKNNFIDMPNNPKSPIKLFIYKKGIFFLKKIKIILAKYYKLRLSISRPIKS